LFRLQSLPTLTLPTLISVAALVLGLASCSGSALPGETGVITAVEAEGLVEWQSLTLLTVDGRELTFLRGDEIDLRRWRVSHLRQHMLLGQTVTVTYEGSPRGRVAVRLRD
jgi:hypothetical protein